MLSSLQRAGAPLVLAALLAACSVPPPPSAETPAVRAPSPPAQVEELCEEDVPEERLGRLTPIQYANAVAELLGAQSPESLNDVPRLPEARGEMPTQLEVETLAVAAEALVKRGAHLALAPCDPAGAHDDGCMEVFIRNLGSRAFRRPVTDEEVETLRAIHVRLRDDETIEPRASFREALDAVAEVVFQAPQLWYRTPVAAVADQDGEVRDADPWLRAERLALLLTDAPPDDALRLAAASGALMDDAVLRAQAERLLETTRGRERLGRFASEWLGLDEGHKQPALEALHKAEPLPPTLLPAMRRETERFYARAVEREQTFHDLLTGTEAFVDRDLAALYGVELPENVGEGWVQLDPQQRGGLLTRAAFLTAHAGPERPSPIRRGVHLYRHLLCQPMGDPPPDASTAQPNPNADLPQTTRRIAEGKTSGPSCQGCHRIVNPPGFAFEQYDALGRFRTHEWAATRAGIDVLAEVDTGANVAFADVRGFVSGPLELSRRLAESPTALDCHALTVFERALARKANAKDSCTLDSLQARFRETGDLRALWLDVATGAPVRKVRVAP